MKEILLAIFVNLLCLSFTYAEPEIAAIQQVDPSILRAFLVYPLASDRSVYNSWIDVLVYNRRFAQITLRDLTVRGKFQVSTDYSGILKIEYIDETVDPKPLLIAAQKLEHDWYPRVELCSKNVLYPNCTYKFQLDQKIKTLSLVINFNK